MINSLKNTKPIILSQRPEHKSCISHSVHAIARYTLRLRPLPRPSPIDDAWRSRDPAVVVSWAVTHLSGARLRGVGRAGGLAKALDSMGY